MIDRDGKEIPPGSFLPTAERFGLIGEIDSFAVGRAIELARGGRAVAVNISGPSLTDRGLIERVGEAIAAGMAPRLAQLRADRDGRGLEHRSRPSLRHQPRGPGMRPGAR